MSWHRRLLRQRPRWSLWQRFIMAALAMTLFLISYQWGQHWRHQHSSPANSDMLMGLQLYPPVLLPVIMLQDQYGSTITSTTLWQHQWTLLAVLPDHATTIQATVWRLIAIHNRLAAATPPLHSVIIIPPAAVAMTTTLLPVAAPIQLYSASAAQQLRLHTVLQLTDNAPSTANESVPLYLINSHAQAQMLFPAMQPVAAIAADIHTSVTPVAE